MIAQLFLAALLMSSQAFAVGTYEAPCLLQEDAYVSAKKALEECTAHLEQARLNLISPHSVAGEKADAPRCLSELKEVNDRAKELRECRSRKLLDIKKNPKDAK